jgi:hypothetical protein
MKLGQKDQEDKSELISAQEEIMQLKLKLQLNKG